jgi:DmsE family decaheme c-type cytochrome
MKVWLDTLAAGGRTSPQPITALSKRAPGSNSRTSFVLALGAAMLCATTIAAQPGETEPDSQQAMRADSSNSGEPAACANCHKEIVKGFAGDPHSKPAPIDGGRAVNCESCHGPGKEHAKSGDAAVILSPSTATAKEVDEKCQSCHDREHSDFQHSVHGRGNLGCIGCHSIHTPGAPKHLLKTEQPQLCFQCHNDVKPLFSLSSHHKVEEGLIDCTDCHDAHGASGENTLPSASWQFIMCTKCHAPAAGPFVYVHPPVKTAGCTFCHFSHGGPNRKLLIHADVNEICLQCHLPSPNPGAGLPAVPEHAQSAQSRSCVSCHANIHGSNTSDVFLKTVQGKTEH